MIIDDEESGNVGKRGRPGAAKIAGSLALVAALAVGCAVNHAWNRGILDEARDAAPDGINLEPAPGEPGAYAVNPDFDAVLAVYLVENRMPTAGAAPREVVRLDDGAWSFNGERSLLRVKHPVDNEKYFVRVAGNFSYPLVFTLAEGTEPASIRLIVEGKLCLEGTDFAFDATSRRLTLLGTSADTEWFCLDYDTAEGSATVSSDAAERLTRAMRAYMDYPVDGNCEAVDGSGRRFRMAEGYAPEGSTPWLLELLPAGEGYVGKLLQPDAFSYDPSTDIIELVEPIDAERFSIFAFAD